MVRFSAISYGYNFNWSNLPVLFMVRKKVFHQKSTLIYLINKEDEINEDGGHIFLFIT